MKFIYSFLLLCLATLNGNPVDNKKSECNGPPMACVIDNMASQDPQFANKIDQCRKDLKEINQMKCIFTAGGMRPDQLNAIDKINEIVLECKAEVTKHTNECESKCSGNNKLDCQSKCNEYLYQPEDSCLFKKANLANYDDSKSRICEQGCYKTKLSDVFDCILKCDEPLFKGLGIELNVSDLKNSEKPKGDKKVDDKSDDKKDEKSRDSENPKDEMKDDKKNDEGSKDVEKSNDDKKSDQGSKDGSKPPNSKANQIQLEQLSLVTFALSFTYNLLN